MVHQPHADWILGVGLRRCRCHSRLNRFGSEELVLIDDDGPRHRCRPHTAVEAPAQLAEYLLPALAPASVGLVRVSVGFLESLSVRLLLEQV